MRKKIEGESKSLPACREQTRTHHLYQLSQSLHCSHTPLQAVSQRAELFHMNLTRYLQTKSE